MVDLPDEWFTDNDGQRLVLDPEKVRAELERLGREVSRLEQFIAVWRGLFYDIGNMI